jgi:hypothetical protein
MLEFTSLLDGTGLDPAKLLVIRHTARDPKLQQVLPWLVEERPDLFLAYQSIQWRAGQQSMLKADYVAAIVGLEPGEATFAGISKVGGSREIDQAGYESFPGNAELMAFGMRSDRQDGMLAFDLEPVEHLQPYVGKLTVSWSPGQTWARWAARNRFPVLEISRESRFVKPMPNWRELTLSWDELRALPKSWAGALSGWRGVYFIYDTERRAGYVGSAAGAENLYGRWRSYAETGHGGNRELRTSRPGALRFSILQRTSPDLEIAEVNDLESSWKRRLLSREFGLNAN